jgi:hypothetical protein
MLTINRERILFISRSLQHYFTNILTIFVQPMEETTTPDIFVQFLYRELSAMEAIETAQMIDQYPSLRQEFSALQSAKMQLPKVLFNPSADVLNRIKAYSASTALEVQF